MNKLKVMTAKQNWAETLTDDFPKLWENIFQSEENEREMYIVYNDDLYISAETTLDTLSFLQKYICPKNTDFEQKLNMLKWKR